MKAEVYLKIVEKLYSISLLEEIEEELGQEEPYCIDDISYKRIVSAIQSKIRVLKSIGHPSTK